MMLLSASLATSIVSCGDSPSRVEQRKAEIRERDSLDMASAMADLKQADSLIAFKEIELEELKQGFVFEKEEKYQTMGYYVTPLHAGNKSRFSFFPEVEESGKLLFVSINKQRQYTFTEVSVDSADYTKQLPASLSASELAAVKQCHALALAMQALQSARKQKEKAEVKIKFYEKKKEKQGI